MAAYLSNLKSLSPQVKMQNVENRVVWAVQGSLKVITFRQRHSRGEMYSDHDRMCVYMSVCLSLTAFSHYCMDLDVSLGEW